MQARDMSIPAPMPMYYRLHKIQGAVNRVEPSADTKSKSKLEDGPSCVLSKLA
jgi:hypothetical protein